MAATNEDVRQLEAAAALEFYTAFGCNRRVSTLCQLSECCVEQPPWPLQTWTRSCQGVSMPQSFDGAFDNFRSIFDRAAETLGTDQVVPSTGNMSPANHLTMALDTDVRTFIKNWRFIHEGGGHLTTAVATSECPFAPTELAR